MIRFLVWLRQEWAIRHTWWRLKRAAKRQKRGQRALPEGFQYTGHSGRRQQMRILRQRWNVARRFRDRASLAARDRLWAVANTKREARYTAMVLSNAALQISEARGEPWAVVLGRLLDDIERASAA